MTPTVTPWSSGSINYNFASSDPGTGNPTYFTGFSVFSFAQQAMTYQAIQLWEAVADIHFSVGSGQISLQNWTSTSIYGGYAYYPGSGAAAGDVWINDDYASNLMILTHEMGHALGLDHNNSGEPSIMANGGNPDGSSTIQLADIESMQMLYGRNTPSGANDTQFGGSGADTISASGGNDMIFGRANGDVLNGNAGDDTIYGDAGSDTIYGGQGTDVIFGGDDNDYIFGNLGNDVIVTGAGPDWVDHAYGMGNDWIIDFDFAGGDRVLVHQSYTLGEVAGQAVAFFADGGALGLVGVSLAEVGYDDWIIA